MRRSSLVVTVLLCQWRWAASEGEPLVRIPNSDLQLAVDAPNGYCMKITGPFQDKPSLSAAAERLGAWSQTSQILCLADADLPEASFQVSPNPKPTGDHGDFGFGPNVGVNLRPRISTSALWPLQANTPTLGVSFKDQAARVVALQATLQGKLVLEMPMVAARFRHQWAIDVQAMNDTTSCQAEGVVGASRIACRFVDPGPVPVQLVVFCGPCALRNARMQITGGGVAKTEFVRSGSRYHETSEPWVALSSSGEAQWVVVVRDSIDGQDKVHEFVVAAVKGQEEVQWKESSSQRYTRLIGTVLLQATFFAAVALLFIPVCAAARPAVAAAALAVPYLAQLAAQQDAPILLKSAFSSWPFSDAADAWHLLLEVFVGMLGTVVLHGYAAMVFLRENGPGSAEMMPHSLSFGSWELRAAGYVALPLASASARIAYNGFSSSRLFHLFCGSLGLAILLGLVALPWKVLRTLRDWFQEGRVICLQHHSDGRTQYVDRVCDQLSAIPVQRRSRILGTWTETGSWQTSPAVAMIQEVEHHGSCKERGGHHWDRHWSTGPWQPLLPHQSSTGSEMRYTAVSEGLRHRPVSVDSSEPLIKGGWRSPKAAAPSALLRAHPISVTTRFCFAQRRGFAGVCGLPWLDAAVPAWELPAIESAVPQMNLRVQARQLSGPFSSGVLSPCFDSANRKPWWWSYDFFLKVMAGCLVALAPEVSIERHVLRIAWLVVMTLMALWVTYTWPHGHWLENLVAVSGAWVLPGGTAFYLYGNELMEHREKAVLTLLTLAYLPTVLALVVCVYSLKITKDQDLPEHVIGWGKLSGNRLGYERLSLDEDDSPVNVNPEAVEIHLADAVLVADAGSKVPRIRLPCEVKLPLRPMHLWMKGAIAVSSSLTDRQPQVAVPAELLLGRLTGAEHPWATVLTPEGGLLLYRDQETNGGLKWQEVLRHFLRGQNALLREAERVLQEEKESLTALEILE